MFWKLLGKFLDSLEWDILIQFLSSVLDSTENKENESVEEAGDAVLTLPDIDTISGIFETIAISWSGIKDQLEKVQSHI